MTFVATRPPYPMLARPGKLDDLPNAIEAGYVIEPKLDGVRCICVVDVAGVHLYNRRLSDITAAFPEVAASVRKHTHGSRLLGRLILDGEVSVTGSNGHPDFQLVQTRANRLVDVEAAVERNPAVYSVFDCLSSGRVDYMRMQLVERRRILEEICRPLVVPTFTQREADLLEHTRVGEGLMLKHSTSRYNPGARDPAWRKIKWEREVIATVGGITFGIGKREPYFGGLLCGVYKPSDTHGHARLSYIGTVGTGFTDQTLEDLMSLFVTMRTSSNPFVELGTDWDTRFFVAPTLRIKVRFSDYTRGGIMRFPRFVGLAES